MSPSDRDELLIRMIEQLRDDLAEDRRTSSESRARTHQRIDEVVERLGRIDTTIALSGEVDAQVRAELNTLKTALAGVTPTVDEWRNLKRIGLWAAGIIVTSGVGIGAAAVTVGDNIVNAITAIRHFFKLP